MDKEHILILVSVIGVFTLKKFLRWRENNKQRIISNISDETCHKCGHNSHKRMMFKEVKKRAEESALKGLSKVANGGDPALALLVGVGKLFIPQDRCEGCLELWKSTQSQALERASYATFGLFLALVFVITMLAIFLAETFRY